jgi:hypothetical protein
MPKTYFLYGMCLLLVAYLLYSCVFYERDNIKIELKTQGYISGFRYGLNEHVQGKYKSVEKTGYIGIDSKATGYQKNFQDQVVKKQYYAFYLSPNSADFDPNSKSLVILHTKMFRNDKICGEYVEKILARKLFEVTTQGKKPLIFRFTCK